MPFSRQKAYDYWNGPPPGLRDTWLKYFKAHTLRIENLDPEFRVAPIPEEQPTVVKVKGFVLLWNVKRKKWPSKGSL